MNLSMNSVPGGYGSLPNEALQALAEVTARDDPSIIGIILTGSAGRGMATKYSDVDVIVVRDEGNESAREVLHSPAIDEIPMTLAELENVKPIGSEGAWQRWSFAWAKVLRDSLGGRISDAVRRQAILSDQEIQHILIGRLSLDEFINFIYRALKSHRAGQIEAARLDSAESIASMLDVVFALSGRVRPYNKYLAWELREHPLPAVDWQDGRLLQYVNGLLEGSETAIREAFIAVERVCRVYDQQSGHGVLSEVIDAWGEELRLMRGQPGPLAAS